MNQKLIFKVIALVFFLGLVIMSMKFSNSGNFKEGLGQIFAVDGEKTMSWCPDHVVDFQWTTSDLPEKTKAKWVSAKADAVKSQFCTIPTDPVDHQKMNTDVATIQFKPLLLAQSAEAKTALLEWNPESKLFRVQGMPFKSTSLYLELVDDSK